MIGALNTARLGAQAPQASSAAPTFEVASIKPNSSDDGRVMMQNQPGRFTATNVTLRLLIRNRLCRDDGGGAWTWPWPRDAPTGSAAAGRANAVRD